MERFETASQQKDGSFIDVSLIILRS